MDIDALLKQIHPLVKKAVADFSKEALELFSEWQKEAEDASEREQLENSLRSFKRHSQQIDKVIMGKLQEQLTELSGKSLEEVSEEYKVKMTAEDLRLIEEADLEQQVALESMAQKMINQVSAELNLLTQRLNKGFNRDDIEDKTNPFGPLMFSENFGQACSKIDVNVDQKLDLFKTFEETGFQSLDDVLANANANLKRQGILPNAEVIHKSSARPEAASRTASDKSSEQDAQPQDAGKAQDQDAQNQANFPALPTHVPAPSGMFDISDPMVKQIFEMIEKDGYAVLQKLLVEHHGGKETRISSSGSGDQDFAEKRELEDEELLSILDSMQKKSLEKDEPVVLEGEFQRANLAQNVGGVLQEKSQQLGTETTLSKTGSDVVSLVDMLFDFILSDDYLADGVKSIISELQVPLTKVALMDPTFFSDNKHPARLLLNELSHSGMAAGKGPEVLEDQSFKSIAGTVKKVQENFDKETTVFAEALTEFTTGTDKQVKRIQVLEKRTLDVEKGRAKLEHAEVTLDQLYAKLRARVPVSKVVDEFLDTAWRDVLMMTCLKFGSHSKQWKSDSELTKKFMRSILLAKKARLDGKQMKIPMELLKLLKLALDRISYDVLETKRLLSLLAKNYQRIAATSADEIREELIQLGGEVAVAKRVWDKPKESGEVEASTLKSDESSETEKPAQVLSEANKERLAKKTQREKEIEEQIKKEQEKIASSPLEALDETIKNLDQDVAKEAVLADEDAPEVEFVEGNSWYDMVAQLPIGAWLELYQSSGQDVLRCKLVANIKSLKKLIFVNKAGAKVAERQYVDFAQELKEQKAKVINDNMIFDQALENVIVNLREK